MIILALLLIPLLLVVAAVAFAFYRHQRILRDRAEIMLAAIPKLDLQCRRPTRGRVFGERAMQQTLNDMGKEINMLVAQNEVESWQRLTRVLTHEIMNAIAPIQCISQVYMDNPDIKGTRYEEGIRAIHKTSMGLTSFVSSYRMLTQLQKPHPAPMMLAPFLQQIATLYPQLEWSIAVPEDLQIKADEHLLHQVFINMTKNALDADAHRMDIRLETDVFYVSNDGHPIPLDARREIFVPFFTTKRTGSGIGLSLSRQILTIQGMTLSLADRPIPGFNVTFEIEGMEG